MDRSVNIVYGFHALTKALKHSILDVWKGSKYVFDID